MKKQATGALAAALAACVVGPAPEPPRGSVQLRGIDTFPEATRRILASVLRSGVAGGVLVPSPRPAKLARELRREIGNLCNVTRERGAVRVTVKIEAGK